MAKAKFVDIDLSFKRHPITGDIGTKTNIEAIKQSVRNLIRTMPYDRKFHPEISCRIKALLFRDVSPITENAISVMVSEVIDNHEPRVTVNKINVVANEDGTQYKVLVIFRINNVPDPISVSTLVRRIR